MIPLFLFYFTLIGPETHAILNPLTPLSDQDNFSLQYQYDINQISDANISIWE